MGKRPSASTATDGVDVLQSRGVHHVLLQLLVVFVTAAVFTFWSAVVFATWPPPARCIVPEADSAGGNLTYGYLLGNVSHYYAPVASGEKDRCDYCPVGSVNGSGQCTADVAIACNRGIVYDLSADGTPTVDSLQLGFGMTCAGAYKHDILMSLLPVGQFIGSFFTFTADKYGRRPVILVTGIGVICGSVLITVVENYFVYAFWLIWTLSFAFVALIANYTLAIESVPESGRVLMTALEGWSIAGGCLLIGTAAVLGVDRWRVIHLVAALPILITACIQLCIRPESINWLLTHGNVRSAMTELRKMERISGWWKARNGHTDVTNDADKEANLKAALEQRKKMIEMTQSSGESATILSLLKTPSTAIVTSVMFLDWFAIGILQFGLIEDTGALPGNPSANYVYSALAMLPGTLTVYPVIRLAGRRGATVLYLGLAGIHCVLAAWLDRPQYAHLEWLATAATMVARACSSGCFSSVYFLTAEIYPTVLRTTSFGACSIFARLGAIAAPQIVVLGTPLVGEWLAYAVFGAVALLASVCSVLLPETSGRVPPNTLDEFRRLCAWKGRKIVHHHEDHERAE